MRGKVEADVEPGCADCGKLSYSAELECIPSSGRYSEHPVSSNLIAKGAGKLAARGSNQNDAASSSQVWLSDAKLSQRARKLAAAGTNQDLSFQERARKLAAESSKSSSTTTRSGRTISAHLVPTFLTSRKVYSNLRQLLNRKPDDKNGRPRCEYVDVGNVYDRRPASRSSFSKTKDSFHRRTCCIAPRQASAPRIKPRFHHARQF